MGEMQGRIIHKDKEEIMIGSMYNSIIKNNIKHIEHLLSLRGVMIEPHIMIMDMTCNLVRANISIIVHIMIGKGTIMRFIMGWIPIIGSSY